MHGVRPLRPNTPRRKVSFSAVCKGRPYNTPIAQKMGLTQERLNSFGEMISRVPLGRPGEAEEIAAAALGQFERVGEIQTYFARGF